MEDVNWVLLVVVLMLGSWCLGVEMAEEGECGVGLYEVTLCEDGGGCDDFFIEIDDCRDVIMSFKAVDKE